MSRQPCPKVGPELRTVGRRWYRGIQHETLLGPWLVPRSHLGDLIRAELGELGMSRRRLANAFAAASRPNRSSRLPGSWHQPAVPASPSVSWRSVIPPPLDSVATYERIPYGTDAAPSSCYAGLNLTVPAQLPPAKKSTYPLRPRIHLRSAVCISRSLPGCRGLGDSKSAWIVVTGNMRGRYPAAGAGRHCRCTG